MRKKMVALFMASIMAMGFTVGCGDTKEEKTEEPVKEEAAEEPAEEEKTEDVEEITAEDRAAYAEKTEEDFLKEYFKDPEGKATVDEYMNFLDTCIYWDYDEAGELFFPLKGWGKADNTVRKAGGACRETPEVQERILKEYKDSPYAQKRSVYLWTIFELDKVGDEKLPLYKEVMEKEEDDHVIITLTDYLRDFMSEPDVMEYFIKLSEDENPQVRRASCQMGLYFETIGETAEYINKLLQDEEQMVRANAVLYASDPSSVPFMAEILKNPDDAALYGDIGTRLARLWEMTSDTSNTVPEAFAEFINYLNITPRSVNQPSYMAINACVGANNKEVLSSQEFYKPEELTAALVAAVQDDATGYNTKSEALKAIAFHGTKEQLESLRGYVESWEDSSAETLLTEYDQLLSEMQ